MDRTPEHLLEDPTLRTDFVAQTSWDEWAAQNAPFFLHSEAREMVEFHMREMGINATYDDALAVAYENWIATLDTETNVDEVLYLQGYDRTVRLRIVDTMHAAFLRRAVKEGLIPERESDVAFREQFGS